MRRTVLLLAVLAGVILSGCSRSAIVRKFYVLEAQPGPMDPRLLREQPLAIKLDVRDFVIAKAYDQTRIALRTRSNELSYYYYHLWAVQPAAAVADMVYEVVAGLELFQRCTRGYSIGPDYYLTGQIMALERSQIGKKESAHLSGAYFLFDAHTELPVLQHPFDKSVELKTDKSMNGFAEIASQMLYEEFQLFLQQIVEYYQNEKP